MLFYTLLIAGLTVLGLALRSFEHPAMVRLGNLLILCTSHLLGWTLTGSHLGGVSCVALWFLLPWIDIATRIRRLEIPATQMIESQAPPGSSRFPALEEITEEIEQEGFEQVEDAGWSHEQQTQFVRVFAQPDERIRATLNFIENEQISFFYVTLRSVGHDGRVWFTWNYPFGTTLKPPGHWQLQRLRVNSFLDLLEAHRIWLEAGNVTETLPVSADARALTAELEQELRSQVDHNERCGLLFKIDTNLLRYTWKGCFFLWLQYVRQVLWLR